jgi:hypothetical protein
MDFAIYIEFPYPAGDELGVLGTEVKNQDLFCHAQRYIGRLEQEKEIRRLFWKRDWKIGRLRIERVKMFEGW